MAYRNKDLPMKKYIVLCTLISNFLFLYAANDQLAQDLHIKLKALDSQINKKQTELDINKLLFPYCAGVSSVLSLYVFDKDRTIRCFGAISILTLLVSIAGQKFNIPKEQAEIDRLTQEKDKLEHLLSVAHKQT